jgi:hypothetical protein
MKPTMIGVDMGKVGGDYTCEVKYKREKGKLVILSHRIIHPKPKLGVRK